VVVVVDDTEDLRDLYADALTEAGYEVFTARDGLAAIEVVARVQPRLVVMDLAMPEMDGWDAMRHIRATNPPDETRPTILAVSAFTTAEARGEAFDAGADGFIDKPCAPDVLVSVVGLYLNAPSTRR
jgi:DNA-binding response OmpR family regulator